MVLSASVAPDSYALLHASLIPGVGDATLLTLIAQSGLLARDWYAARIADMVACGVDSAIAARLVKGLADRSILEHELEVLDAQRVSWATCFDSLYPYTLSSYVGKPPVIYWRGNFPVARGTPVVAVVGARDANEYAQHVVDALVPPLVAAGCVLVSGGARGVDTMVHQATLAAGGKTIMIIGSGLAHVYPAANARLYKAVQEHDGAVVSIFPFNQPPAAFRFPLRNRVIAGISDMVVVVQAARNSGTSITAQYALQQGKEVGIVPGSIFDPLSQGCHTWLKEGAHCITSATDIGEILGIKQLCVEHVDKRDAVADVVAPGRQYQGVSAFENRILDACRTTTCTTDELVRLLSDNEYAQVQQALFSLQCKGYLIQGFDGQWRAQG